MITQKQVKEYFTYKDGFLYWNESGRGRSVGVPAGCKISKGYICIRVNGELLRAHKLIFLYHHGLFPKQIDHIDNNKSNNKIENLRECTDSQNRHNMKLLKNNTSGIKGVTWYKITRKWKAQITYNNKHYHLGYFLDNEVADQVVRIERIRLHGEFCNHG